MIEHEFKIAKFDNAYQVRRTALKTEAETVVEIKLAKKVSGPSSNKIGAILAAKERK